MSTLESRPATNVDLVVRDLGETPYAEALSLQRDLQQRVTEARSDSANSSVPGYVLLVEHVPPVITISRRKTARQHLIASVEQLRTAGVEIAETDRGGDVTYHGPGQLVVYPILDLNALGLRLHGYMRFLEQTVIDVMADFEIDAHRDPTATGVWVGAARHNVNTSRPQDTSGDVSRRGSLPHQGTRKICAMGVRVSRWVSMHGLALNVTTNLDHFDLIVPCGLAGRSVTSMHRELDDQCPTMDEVKSVLVDRFREGVAQRAASGCRRS